MTDASIPDSRNYAEGESILQVNPEDIKRMWEFERPRNRTGSDGWKWLQDLKAALSPGVDFTAVSSRCGMIRTLIVYKLLAPWQHGEELDDAVFRVAATFPLRELKYESYMVAGDERFGFDPNAFVQRLVKETGISHVWEPVANKVSGRMVITRSAEFKGQVPNPERKAKQQARDILWELWKRFAPSLHDVVAHSDKEGAAQIVATFFADFLIDNIDLVRQLENSFRDRSVPLDPILSELERKAQA